jgi:hypothetical protein
VKNRLFSFRSIRVVKFAKWDWAIIERDFVYLDEGNGCWLWKGPKDYDGYGSIYSRWPSRYVHRIFYEHYVGPIPEGMFVCHSCDVPNCVNPDHLWVGTNLDNLRDRDKKGRAARGDNHGLRLHPEKRARGDRNGSRTHPEKLPRGDNHWSFKIKRR